MQGTPNPTITIVTATYNRSNILRYTIESVLRSTWEDWELLIIGDACTDDTADVVASFTDSRITFVNVEKNFGEQSGPNNVGSRMARGRYIAYLNHDDLYFSDHLQTNLELIESTGADLVFSGLAMAKSRTPQQLETYDWKIELANPAMTDRYEPFVYAPASSWLLRRELFDEIGPWRPARECYCESSQNFLFRAWQAKRDIRFNPMITVLAVQSGGRKNSYSKRIEHENAFYYRQMIDNPRFREQVASAAAIEMARKAQQFQFRLSPLALASRLLYKPLLALGINPKDVRMFLRYGRGGFINRLREQRGLPKLR
jgi:glycosyltransferase involved in cell wall biosynthesis